MAHQLLCSAVATFWRRETRAQSPLANIADAYMYHRLIWSAGTVEETVKLDKKHKIKISSGVSGLTQLSNVLPIPGSTLPCLLHLTVLFASFKTVNTSFLA